MINLFRRRPPAPVVRPPANFPSDEARAYAFAADLVRRLGPDEAGRIADLVVRDVQLISRGGE